MWNFSILWPCVTCCFGIHGVPSACTPVQVKYLGKGNTRGWTAGQWQVFLFYPIYVIILKAVLALLAPWGCRECRYRQMNPFHTGVFCHPVAKNLSFCCCCCCCLKTYYSWDSSVYISTIMILIGALKWECSDFWNFRPCEFLCIYG